MGKLKTKRRYYKIPCKAASKHGTYINKLKLKNLTACTKSPAHFYVASQHIKMDKTSWTDIIKNACKMRLAESNVEFCIMHLPPFCKSQNPAKLFKYSNCLTVLTFA